MFAEGAEPDVAVVEDDGDNHDGYGPEHIDIDRRGLLDGLLGALLGVLNIIPLNLGKTLDGVLTPVLSLLLAAEPGSANQFTMQANKLNIILIFLVYKRRFSQHSLAGFVGISQWFGV